MTLIDYNWIPNLQFCAAQVADNIDLLRYSHFSAILVSLAMGFLVWKLGTKNVVANYLLGLIGLFCLWTISNYALWSLYAHSSWVMFAWSNIEIIAVFLFLITVQFYYSYIYQHKPPLWLKIASWLILIPIILVGPTAINLPYFDLNYCEASENQIFIGYIFWLKVFLASWLFLLAIWSVFKSRKENRKSVAILSAGIIAFLVFFFIATRIAELTGDYRYEFYGQFGTIIFVGLLTYLIATFNIFRIKILGAQALVGILVIISTSQIFFAQTTTSAILSVVTIFLSATFGFILLSSISKEAKQRSEIESLANQLANQADKLYSANEKLQILDRQKTEFVSIASHQLRTPLTAVKGYASMLLEGSFGKLDKPVKESVEKIFESSQHLVNIIEDFLNITRIELGKMKYELVEFDLKETATKVIEELQSAAERKNLKLEFKAEKGNYKIIADSGKISQVISNLLDNGLKYTQAGSVLLSLSQPKAGTVLIAVKDTGVGISQAVIPKLFEKFIRSDDAGKTNISGTGLGLYVAKQIIEAHKGKIWGESEGKGKGATFFVELPTK